MRVPATPAGYDRLHDFVRSHGRIRMIGIEGTGSWGAGLARAPGGRRRTDPRGHPSQALPAPPRQVRSDRRLRRRRQSTGRGRRPARGQDRHRPLRTDPGAPGLAPQRDEGPRPSPTGRSPPCRPPPPTPCAPAPHRLSGEGAHQRPGPHAPRPGHRHPRIGDRASAAPPGPPPPDPDRRDRRHRHRAARTNRPRRPDDARHQGAAPSTTATLLVTAGDNPGRIRTEASFAALCGAAPIPAGPREDQPPPTQPRRRPTGQLGAAPDRPGPPVQRPAHQGLRRPPHRHGQELQRDTAPPPNAPSPAKHGTC